MQFGFTERRASFVTKLKRCLIRVTQFQVRLDALLVLLCTLLHGVL